MSVLWYALVSTGVRKCIVAAHNRIRVPFGREEKGGKGKGGGGVGVGARQ